MTTVLVTGDFTARARLIVSFGRVTPLRGWPEAARTMMMTTLPGARCHQLTADGHADPTLGGIAGAGAVSGDQVVGQ